MKPLERSLDILEHLGTRGPQTARDVASAIGTPMSTTYRILRLLKDAGFVTSYENHYDLGARMVAVASRIDVGNALGRLASPVMWSLVERFGETAVMTVVDGWNARCVEAFEPRRTVRLSFQPGTVHPLHIGASAKPLLANAPVSRIDDYLGNLLSSDPQANLSGIRADLERVRADGVSVSHGELDRGAVAVGAAFFCGMEVGCISVAGPAERMNERKVNQVIIAVKAAAAGLSRSLSAGTD